MLPSSFSLFLLLVGPAAATPAKDLHNVKRQPPPGPPPGPPPPPPPMQPGWKPEKPPKHKPFVEPPKAKVLFRGEYFRGPEDVKVAGGFDSHAKRIFQRRHSDYEGGMDAEMFKKGSSLYEHAFFKNPVSSYVPTSRAREEAIKFAQNPEKTGYLYRLRSHPDMVDVVGSLGGEDYFKHFKEQEVAGVYDIPWSRVESWQEVKRDASTQEYKVGEDTANPDFVEEPSGEGAYLSHHELAGWTEGAVAWENDLWKPYKDMPVEGFLNEFLLKHRHNNDVEAFKTWRGAEEWAVLPCSGSRKRAGGADPCALLRNEPSQGTAGEAGTNPAAPGKEPGDKPAVPQGEDVPLDEAKLAELAEASEREFADSAAARGLTLVAKSKWSLDPRDVRAKLLGYKPLTAESPKIRSMKGGLSGLAVVGVAAWAGSIVETFIKDASALDRAAAITSIIPFVGCGFGALSEAEGEAGVDVLDKMMCIYGDILLLTPLAPFGFVVHLFRGIISQFKPKSLPTAESVQKSRDRIWARFLDDKVYTYFYSDHSLSGDREFRDKLNSSLAIEALAILSSGADSIAVANISAKNALEAGNADKAQIQAGALEAVNKLRAETSDEIVRGQRRLLLDLPNKLRENATLSLKPIADEYNSNFIKELTSPEMVTKYKTIYPGDPGVPGSQRDDAGDIAKKLSEIGKQLADSPPALPRLFDIAYVLGQSKGLQGLDPRALTPQDFLRDQVPGLSEFHLNFFSLHHTLQVSQLLQGKITEDKLSTLWPSKDNKARQLQILLALRFGKTFEEQKIKLAQGFKGGAAGTFLNEKEVRFSTHPNIPPHGRGPESFAYLGLILGLSEERVKSLPPDQQVVGYKELVGDEQLVKAMLKQAMASSTRDDAEDDG